MANNIEYEKLYVKVPAGTRKILEMHAGVFDNGDIQHFINRSIRETIARDKAHQEKLRKALMSINEDEIN